MQRELTFVTSCEQTITTLSSTLARQGIRLERSFDLRSALRDQPDCPCPQHGIVPCMCQYVVLLAYESAIVAPPVTITAHACDGLTRVSVSAGEAGGKLSWPLLTALDEALTNATADA